MTTSPAGSLLSASKKSWTPAVKRDTTSSAAALHDAWWAARPGRDCADWWLNQQHARNLYIYNEVMKRLPGASEREIRMAWFAEKYGDSISPGVLSRAFASTAEDGA